MNELKRFLADRTYAYPTARSGSSRCISSF